MILDAERVEAEGVSGSMPQGRGIRSFAGIAAAAIAAALAMPGAALGQQPRDAAPGLETETLEITPGGTAFGRGGIGPGSGDSDHAARLKWRDMLFLNSLDGIGYNLITGDGFRLGVTTPDGFNQPGTFDGLWSLGAPDHNLALGAFGQYSLDNWTFEASVSRMTDGSGGLVADLGVRWNTRISDSWLVELGPSVTWASGDYSQALYGPQSRGSGLRLHDANPGLKDLTVSGSVSYSLSDNWTVGGMVGAQRFLGDATDAPLSKDDSNIFGGISFGYRF